MKLYLQFLVFAFLLMVVVVLGGCSRGPASVTTKAAPNYRGDMMKWHKLHDKLGQKPSKMPANQN